MKRSILLRVIAFLSILIIICAFSAGCSSVTSRDSSEITEESNICPEFECLGQFDSNAISFNLYRDPVTDLLYLSYRYKCGYAGGASLLPYYDSDGSHMTYSRFLSLNVGGDE